MSRFGDGLSVEGDLLAAARYASAAALVPLNGRTPDLVTAFVHPGLAPSDEVDAVAAVVAEATEAGTVIGCTASGVIGGSRAVEQQTAVSVWAGVLPEVTVRPFHLEVMRTDSAMAVVGMPVVSPQTAAALLLADPYSFPADGFVERSNDTLRGLPIVGGLAAGMRGAGTTRLYLDGRAHHRGAVGVLLDGPAGVRAVVSQGCRPVGPAMTVTAATGNVLLGLAGVPALTKLREILGALPPAEQALASRGLQIGVAMDEYADEYERGDFLVRGVLGADPDRDGVVVGDLVEVGRTVRFQVRDADAATDDLQEVLASCRRAIGRDAAEGVLLFSCNGRGAHLFSSADHDVLAVRRELAPDGVGGFFAGGEIGPVGGRNHLHGFTASMLVFSRPPAG